MYIIKYDISSDRLRNKVAVLLEGYGKWVQYSCFECNITIKQYEELKEKLEKLMKDVKEGNVRIYHLCKNCDERILVLGKPSLVVEDSDVYVIWMV